MSERKLCTVNFVPDPHLRTVWGFAKGVLTNKGHILAAMYQVLDTFLILVNFLAEMAASVSNVTLK